MESMIYENCKKWHKAASTKESDEKIDPWTQIFIQSLNGVEGYCF